MRPTRVMYPCQQTFLTQVGVMSQGVLAPILAIIPLGFRDQIKRIMTKKNIFIFSIILIAFIGGIYFSSEFRTPNVIYVEKISSGKIVPSVPLNNVPQSRVISVRDEDATSWDFSCKNLGSPCPEYYSSNDNVDQDVVNEMFDKGLIELTGAPTIQDAWNEIIPNFQLGQSIAIKVNFNGIGSYDEADAGIDAVPQPAVALIRGLVMRGFEEQNIKFYEGIKKIPNRYRDIITAHYPNVRFYDWPGEGDVERVTWSCADPSSYVDFSHSGYPNARCLPDQVVDSDYLIDMPIIKGHGPAGITLSFKNHFGTMWWQGAEPHGQVWPGSGGYDSNKNPLVDIYLNPHVQGKTVLIVGEGLFGGFWHSGAVEEWISFGNDEPNMMFFSVNPVAIDSVMYDYLLREEVLNPNLDILSGAGDVMQVAEDRGLGIYEHWNNDVDRQYPNIDYIEIDLDDCIPDCNGKQCGDDGCSPYDETDCGTCSSGHICSNYICEEQFCVPGQTQVCDTGLLGICSDGTETCLSDGSAWGPCIQNSQSVPEDCGNGLDDDCDGAVDYEDIEDCSFICGEFTGDDFVDIDDAIYLINYIFTGGPAPVPLQAGNVDLQGEVDIDDVIYLIDYIFTGGSEPCNPDKSYVSGGHEDWTEKDVNNYISNVQKEEKEQEKSFFDKVKGFFGL